VSELAEKHKSFSGILSKYRLLVQACYTAAANIHISNFFKGEIYRGNFKVLCVPVLNCYSCPGASGACPIGAYQAVAGSSKFSVSMYILGFLILVGMLLGRFVCGFLCPFGWLQELINKIPFKKFSTKKLHVLTYLKYIILVVMVFTLPAVVTNELGMGNPFFCKYICPQGVLEGAIPLALANEGIRSALGRLFTWKTGILLAVIFAALVWYRPFCKWLCPLGAFYAVMNKLTLLGMTVNQDKCVACGKCVRACPMDVDITKSVNHTECIRCGKCVKICPTDAIRYSYGIGERVVIHNTESDIKNQ
jgi:ferredoxin-type protein NapH